MPLTTPWETSGGEGTTFTPLSWPRRRRAGPRGRPLQRLAWRGPKGLFSLPPPTRPWLFGIKLWRRKEPEVNASAQFSCEAVGGERGAAANGVAAAGDGARLLNFSPAPAGGFSLPPLRGAPAGPCVPPFLTQAAVTHPAAPSPLAAPPRAAPTPGLVPCSRGCGWLRVGCVTCPLPPRAPFPSLPPRLADAAVWRNFFCGCSPSLLPRGWLRGASPLGEEEEEGAEGSCSGR